MTEDGPGSGAEGEIKPSASIAGPAEEGEEEVHGIPIKQELEEGQ